MVEKIILNSPVVQSMEKKSNIITQSSFVSNTTLNLNLSSVLQPVLNLLSVLQPEESA